MPGPNQGTVRLRLTLSLGRCLRLTRRQSTAKSKRDSCGSAEAVLGGKAEVVQVAGVEVIDRPQLKSDVTKRPIINANASSNRHRCICYGAPGIQKSGIVSTRQAVHEARDPAGVIPKT